MKVFTLLIFLAVMQVSAATYAQKVTLSEKNASLTKIFNEIRQQCGYDFVMTQSMLDKSKPVTIHVTGAELKDVLEQIFADQPLEYEINDKSVLIREKTPTILEKIKSALNLDKIDIHGQVVDENNLPLAGATVIIKGTSNSTTTDAKGNFTLSKVDPNATLVITFVGYEKQEIPATNNIGVIHLKVATSALDAVQVIAYGQQTQRYSVGDVTTISSKEIETQPVNNPLLALEGKVPGLIVTQSTGIAGGGVKVQIRGQNNFDGSSLNDPLYVVDGVPYPAQLLHGLNTILGQSNSTGDGAIVGNPLSFISPDDIESISVLKDADATSIYGTRAANGAILITTKKGKAGDARVNVNLQNGFGEVAHFLPLMNTQQYLQMRHEALKNDHKNPGKFDWDVNGTWDTTRYTDWQKELIGGTAKYSDYNASVSGGSELTQFLIGSAYHKETTVFPADFSDEKVNVHFNVSSSTKNQKLRVQLTGTYLVDDNRLPQFDVTEKAMLMPPDAPALFNRDGSVNWAPDGTGTSTMVVGPAYYFQNKYTKKTNNLIGSGEVSYQFTKDLSLSSTFGYNNLQSNETFIFPLSGIEPEDRPYSVPSALFGNSNIHSWNVEPQLRYKHLIGKGNLNAIIGATINQSFTDDTQINASGQGSDQTILNLSSATSFTVSTTDNSVYKYAALFARVQYNWDGKYLVSLSGRRDGSSRFGPKNQFANFGSAGAGWIFSEESFVKNNLTWLSFGKIRASYGTTGSDQIGDYKFLNLYSFNIYGVPYQNIPSLSPTGLPNPYLQWQLTRKLEIGADLGFLKDRILISADYFRNRSSNQLLNPPLPIIAGGGLTENLPATVQNKGWEFSLNTENIKRGDFKWSSSFNISIIRNKLIEYPSYLPPNSYLVVGRPINYTQVFHFIGVDPTTGLYTFSDGKGGLTNTPIFDPANSRFVNLDLNPKFYGALNNSINYKGLTLNLQFQFVKQQGPNYFFGPTGLAAGYKFNNEPAWLLNRWQKPGDVATYEKYSTGFSFSSTFQSARFSDAAYGDASYVRLKNASISWQLPKQWISHLGVRDIQVYALGQNLLTFTKYKGLDPETMSSIVLPPLRVITFGVKSSL